MEDFFTVNVVVDLTQHGAVYLLLCLLVKTAVYLFAFKYTVLIPEEYYSYNSIKALSSCPQGIFHKELIANQLMEVFHVTNTINNKNPVINKMTKIVYIMTTQPIYPYHLVSPDSSITQCPHFCSKHPEVSNPTDEYSIVNLIFIYIVHNFIHGRCIETLSGSCLLTPRLPTRVHSPQVSSLNLGICHEVTRFKMSM